MIPKIIHYVWVGDKPKTELALRCIQSWEKYCPDFQIREWGNETLNKISNHYAVQAFNCKKWAFVSDYLRLYALYNYGGIYLDADCELTAPIDEFLQYSYIMCYESFKKNIINGLGTGFLGSSIHNSDIRALLDMYENLEFVDEFGTMNQTANVARFGEYFNEKYNLKKPYDNNKPFYFGDNGVIFPSSYFCTPYRNLPSYAIHHFVCSWQHSYTKDVLFTYGKYSLLKFTQKVFPAYEGFRLLPNEKLLCKVHIGKRYFGIVKTE